MEIDAGGEGGHFPFSVLRKGQNRRRAARHVEQARRVAPQRETHRRAFEIYALRKADGARRRLRPGRRAVALDPGGDKARRKADDGFTRSVERDVASAIDSSAARDNRRFAADNPQPVADPRVDRQGDFAGGAKETFEQGLRVERGAGRRKPGDSRGQRRIREIGEHDARAGTMQRPGDSGVIAKHSARIDESRDAARDVDRERRVGFFHIDRLRALWRDNAGEKRAAAKRVARFEIDGAQRDARCAGAARVPHPRRGFSRKRQRGAGRDAKTLARLDAGLPEGRAREPQSRLAPGRGAKRQMRAFVLANVERNLLALPFEGGDANAIPAVTAFAQPESRRLRRQRTRARRPQQLRRRRTRDDFAGRRNLDKRRAGRLDLRDAEPRLHPFDGVERDLAGRASAPFDAARGKRDWRSLAADRPGERAPIGVLAARRPGRDRVQPALDADGAPHAARIAMFD